MFQLSLGTTSIRNLQHSIQYISLMLNSIHRRNYLGLSVRVSAKRKTNIVFFLRLLVIGKYSETLYQLFIDFQESL
jgi:hypothetical protein